MNDGDIQHVEQLSRRLDGIERSLQSMARSIERIDKRSSSEPARLHASMYHAVESLMALYRRLDDLPAIAGLADPFGGWSLSSDMARMVVELLIAERPSLVLELGSGSSTVLLGQLKSLLPDMRVVSLEHDSVWYADTLVRLAAERVDEQVELRYAPLTEIELADELFSWYDPAALEDLDRIDCVIVDGPPGHIGDRARYPAGPLIEPLCEPGCLWIVDDIVRESERTMVEDWVANQGVLEVGETVWSTKGAVLLRSGAGT